MSTFLTQDIIDNLGDNTVSAALTKLMPSTKRLDALVGYFYFSGFKEIYKEVNNIQIRILVGLELDSAIIQKLGTIDEADLDNHLETKPIVSKTSAKKVYFDNFAAVFNKTDIFDSESSIEAFKVFLEKIKNGSLEIKKTAKPEHGKFYLMTFADDKSQEGLIPGVVIEGSSNLTYSGLTGRGEHNRLLKETHYYLSDQARFEGLWQDSENIVIADINNVSEFENELKQRLWLYAKPDPYLVYIRLLDEYFGDAEVEGVKTPGQITKGQYSDLKYQLDAIELGIDRINKFGGVIVADVVGLGKSIIASAIANNLAAKTIIIAPPHLKEQWEDYRFEFNFNAQVYTTGEIEKALERHGKENEEMLIILDEAHKHRNEDTASYQALHKLCAGNRVMALTATPFNNDPKDIYAIIKLFDTPGQSTLRTVENLSMEFHSLMSDYKKLRSDIRKQKDPGDPSGSAATIQKRGEKIARTLRQMIEPVVIRRSRLDLTEITAYRDDLKSQGISFAKVEDPELLEYDLGKLSSLYVETLDKIASPQKDSVAFIGARYKPVAYLKEGSKFFDSLFEGSDLSPEDQRQRLEAGQGMIALFMRRLLVRRFESSMAAFESSLSKMRLSAEKMLDWMDRMGEVPVYKKGDLPDAEDLELMDEQEVDDMIEHFEAKGLIRIPVSEIQPQFRDHLISDIQLLKDLHSQWFLDGIKDDPKFDYFLSKVSTSLSKEPARKLIVFSEYSDTANYVAERLEKAGMRVFKYSAADASKENKRIIRANFDAGLPESEQKNDYDILMATDAISEGYNLHRAGSIINYDIPYNPTRVIQRVGRINRINKQVFNELYIYNFFPTFTGEKETKTKAITTLKINLIHVLLGEDTKILTSNEELRNYFAKQYREQEAITENLSWDAKHRKVWLDVRRDEELMKKAKAIPLRTRIGKGSEINKGSVVAFGKLGSSYVFAKGYPGMDAERASAEEAMAMFEAVPAEKACDTTVKFNGVYHVVKQHLFKKNTQVTIKSSSRRFKAIQHLMLLSKLCPGAKDHVDDVIKIIKEYDGFPDGLLTNILGIRIKPDSPRSSYDELRSIVPDEYIEDINKTALRSAGEGDFVLLSEELV